MAYSNVGIANMMLQRIGAKSSITSLTDGSVNAVKINSMWEYIRDEVLEAIKPKFATVRVVLAQSSTDPVNTDVYLYAYPLPSDYLCLADSTKDDPTVSPFSVGNYVIETLTDGTLCLMCNYDSVASGDIYLTYIRKVTDPAKYSPSFINCFTYRGAAELCLAVVEGTGKFEAMMKLYMQTKRRAQGMNRAQDNLVEEKGSNLYEYAGR